MALGIPGSTKQPASSDLYRGNHRFSTRVQNEEVIVFKLLLFCILLVVCWPLALIALVLYPLVWLILLPFRIMGLAVHGALELISAIFMLPVRLLRSV